MPNEEKKLPQKAQKGEEEMKKNGLLKMVGVVEVCVMAAQLSMGAETGSTAENNKGEQWTFTPDPKLPNVLILGDSISIGYTLEVRNLMAGKANVYRPLSEDGKGAMNCSGTTEGVKKIDGWLGDTKWAVIHFNWGLHDLKHVTKTKDGKPSDEASGPVQATVDQYSKNLEEIVKKLKATGAKLIFATTTPVVPGTKSPLREPEAPGKYNEAAVSIMTANGIKVNDLYGVVMPQLEKLQYPKNVHFNPKGSKALAGQVAKVIEAELIGK